MIETVVALLLILNGNIIEQHKNLFKALENNSDSSSSYNY